MTLKRDNGDFDIKAAATLVINDTASGGDSGDGGTA
jgi:hypothetical protein